MLAISRFLASGSYLQGIAPKLRELQAQFQRVSDDHDRLEAEVARAEREFLRISKEAWDLVNRTPSDEDQWSLGDLHPDYWE
jgi:predicted nuclease with TOPRIM domain